MSLLGSAYLPAIPYGSAGLSGGDVALSTGGGVGVTWSPVTGGLPTSGERYGVAFGDVDNDGLLDVAFEGSGDHVYVGVGPGSFVEQSNGLPLSSGTYDVALADFNNDGNLDLAASGVYLGDGGAGGSMTWTPATSPGGWNAVAAADVNIDGDMDIVAGTSSGVNAWAGNGGAGGTLVWTLSSVGLPISGDYWGVKSGDVNNDGKPDIVSAMNGSGLWVWTGNGQTGVSSQWTLNRTGLPTTNSYASVDIGDVNNDGSLDIVSTAYYDAVGVRVWLGNGGAGGSMQWTENSAGLDVVSNGYLVPLLRDVNNDGKLDIIASHYQGGGLTVWLGDGGAGGSMDWTLMFSTPGNYIDLDAGDYNNDGKTDFVATHNSGVEVWMNERPSFDINAYVSASVNLPVANTWADVQMADVNRDGKLDIGFTSFQGQNRGIRVFLGDRTGVWTNSSNGLPTTGSYTGLRFGDINHDGDLDLVAGREGAGGNNEVQVWRGNGLGGWTQMAPASTRSGCGLELADINNDGSLDVITGYYANNWGPMVYLGNGDFTWSGNVGPVDNTNVDDVAVADVNHDGKLDLAASSMNNVGIRLWTGDGTATPSSWQRNDTGLPATGGGVYLGLAFADVDHDGHQDLAGAAYNVATGVDAWLGNGGVGGTMTWTLADSGLPSAGQFGGVEFGDTNVDGNLDLVAEDARNAGSTGIVYRRGNGGAGGMSWSTPAITGLPTSGQHWGVAFGDMDNDGILDIAATSNAGVRVYKQGSPPVVRPQVTLSYPAGGERWSGNSPHNIWWNMSDDSINPNLVVYLNYSYNAGASTGAITGPRAGTPNPNSYGWTTPLINANDVIVNITVIDPGGLKGWDETPVSTIDSDPPGVFLTIPTNTATGVPIDQSVVIRFDESMQRAPTEAAFTIAPDPGGWSWSWSTTAFTDDTMTGTHIAFQYNQPYTVTILQTAMDASSPGNQMTAQYAFTFTTVPPNAPPTITVDSPIAADSWSGGSNHFLPFTANDVEDPPSSLLVWLNYSPTGIAPWSPVAGPVAGDSSPISWSVPLDDTTSARIKADVVDTQGGWGTATSAAFEVDSALPTVTLTSPANSQTNVPTNAVIQVTWSESMNRTATEGSFQLYETATWTPVPGQMSWAGNVFVFDPDFDLSPDAFYTANFTTQAKDDSSPGNNLAALYSWTFRTAATPDTTPPEITDVRALPSPQEVHFYVNVSAIVTDDFGVGIVSVNISGPAGISNTTMAFDGVSGRHYHSATYDVIGQYNFVVWASDVSLRWNYSAGLFRIVDTTRPTITHAPVVSAYVGAPINLTATVTDNYILQSVRLNFTNVDGASYNITLSAWGQDRFSYVVPAQPHSGTVLYHFWAVDSSGNGARTQSYVISVLSRRPSPPENLVVTPEGYGSLQLSWDAPTTNEDDSPLTDLAGFNVYRMTEPGGQRSKVNDLLVLDTSFLDTGLEEGRTYYYVVTAVNSTGSESADSNRAPGTTNKRPSGLDVSLLALILVIIVAVVAILLLVLLKKRRKKEEQPPETEKMEEGKEMKESK